MSMTRTAARTDRLRPAASLLTLVAGAGLLGVSGSLPAAAQSDAPATGRAVIAELPRLPDGPVCLKDRDWMVVEAEQYISRTTARAEELSKKAIELELAVDRDPAAGRNAEAAREELRETLRRVRDAQGYREDARRLATRDCLVREGQGLDVRQAAASVSSAATAQAPNAAEPAIDVRLAQSGACKRDTDCEISLVSETRRPATDDRRVAVLVDLPSVTGTFVRSTDAWKCYAMVGGAVCLAKLMDLKPGSPVESRLTWRIQGSATDADARFCSRAIKASADGRPTTDPDRIRVLQAVLADYGYRTGAIDGRFADGTRVVLASAAPDFGIERNADDDRIAAALLGSMVSRVGVSTGPCLQLAMAPTDVTPTSDAPGTGTGALIGAAAAAAAAASARTSDPAVPPRAPVAAVAPVTDPAARATEPAGPPRPQSASVAPERDPAPSELSRTPVKPTTKKTTVTTTKAKPTPVARVVPDEPDVVVTRPKKKRVVAEDDSGPVVVGPNVEVGPNVVVKRPKVFVPPIGIGIGIGRRGGIGFGF